MTTKQKNSFNQRLINNLNERLFAIEVYLRTNTVTGAELQTLAKSQVRIKGRLAELYGTEKLELV